MSVEELYETLIKPLSLEERARLISIAAQDLAQDARQPETTRQRSLLELEGLGAELWEGIEAQDYVDQLREEWDHRP